MRSYLRQIEVEKQNLSIELSAWGKRDDSRQRICAITNLATASLTSILDVWRYNLYYPLFSCHGELK